MIYDLFSCKNLTDFHNVYVLSDTVLLADVFENFRNLSIKQYRLDPAHFVSLPSYTLDACLLKCKVKLELITDPSIFCFIESGLRGGLCKVTCRHAKANNPLLENYNSNHETSYISYVDCNSLYASVMTKCLPTGGFRFLDKNEIESIDFMSIPDDNKYGYIIQCDLQYPRYLHDLHNDYPIACQKKIVSEDMLSPYTKQLMKKLNAKLGNCPKLIADLNDKTNYICHYVNLKQYIRLGLVLSKITHVLVFEQSAWLKPYIDFNIQMRMNAKNAFEKQFYKLLLNALFGKFLQDSRKHCNVYFTADPKKASKIISKQNVRAWKIVDKDLCAFQLTKLSVCLNKPIYAGFTILELSKELMNSYHYDHIKKLYKGKAKLLYTDTDSFVHLIFTDDLYVDMNKYRHLYDLSDYPRTHFLYDDKN